MNHSMIRYILGHVLKIEAAFLLLPCLTAVYYQETVGLYYLGVAALCFLFGMLMTIRKPKSNVFYLKEGCVATALSWIFLSLFGCIPFFASGEIPSFVDALFETISGFTTTGTTILTDVEALSHCSLFWRSFTHWIGGMGVLVFLLAIIPMSGGSNINLMRAESPGPSVGKLVPKIKYTARILYLIYLSMTALEFILLLVGRMPIFDAITTAFGTAGTGGFAIRNSSIADYSPYLQWVVTIFMIAFGINFNFYYYLLYRQFKKAVRCEEVRVYLGVIIVAVAIIFSQIVEHTANVWDALRHSTFQVASIITTTGFSTVDINEWTQTSKAVLVLLMFVGACAGSTGGGMKISRFIIAFKTVIKELSSYIHPKIIKKIRFEGKPVEHETVRSVNVYFMTFLMVFATSVLLISIEGYDLTTSFTSVASAINNIGPGLNQATYNFSFYSNFSKIVFMIDMLAGRLELFPLLILFHPGTWNGAFRRKKNH